MVESEFGIYADQDELMGVWKRDKNQFLLEGIEVGTLEGISINNYGSVLVINPPSGSKDYPLDYESISIQAAQKTGVYYWRLRSDSPRKVYEIEISQPLSEVSRTKPEIFRR